MRWSIEELLEALGSVSATGVWNKILYFPKVLYMRIKIILHWISKGYCKISLMDLDITIYREILNRLKQFLKEDRIGFPNKEFKNREDWENFLKNLVDRFEDIVYNEPSADTRILKKNETIDKKFEFISSNLIEGEDPVVINTKRHYDWEKRKEETLNIFIKNISYLWH